MGTGREKHHDSPMAMEMISGALEQFFPRKTMGKPLEHGDVMGINPIVSGWWFGTFFVFHMLGM